MKGAKFSAEEREKMYIETLNFYIDLFSRHKIYQDMVLAENSGWDLNSLRSKIHKSAFTNIEYIPVSPEKSDQNRGKSYNELLMMQTAIDISKTIKDAGCFIKLTGRFPLVNIISVIKELYRRGGRKLSFFGDCKDHRVYERLRMPINGHSGESRFYAMSLDFWNENFRDCYRQLNDFEGHCIEKFLLCLKRTTGKRHDTVWRLRTQPHFAGKGGHVLGNGPAFFYSTDNDSYIMRFKRNLRQMARWMLPWWWC